MAFFNRFSALSIWPFFSYKFINRVVVLYEPGFIVRILFNRLMAFSVSLLYSYNDAWRNRISTLSGSFFMPAFICIFTDLRALLSIASVVIIFQRTGLEKIKFTK